MVRATILLLTLGVAGAVVANGAPVMWPLRATVTDLHGRPVAFQAVTHGGDLIVTLGERSVPGHVGAIPEVEPLRRGDTLRATTPAAYPIDPTRGPIVFFAGGRDSIRIVVRRVDEISSVIAVGRRLTVRGSNSGVTIDAK